MDLNKYVLMFPRAARRLLGHKNRLDLELGVFESGVTENALKYSFEDFQDEDQADLRDMIADWSQLSVPDNCVLDFYCYDDTGLVCNVLFKIENGQPTHITELGSTTYPWQPLEKFL